MQHILLPHWAKFTFLIMLVSKIHNICTTKAYNSSSTLISVHSFDLMETNIQALSQYFHVASLFPGSLP